LSMRFAKSSMQTGMAPKRWALWKAPNEPKTRIP
jgi:hypothetical protein